MPEDLSFSRLKPVYGTICIIFKRARRASSVPDRPRVSPTRVPPMKRLRGPHHLPGWGHCYPSFLRVQPQQPFPRRRGPCPLPNTSPPLSSSLLYQYIFGSPGSRGCAATCARAPRGEEEAGGSCTRSPREGGPAEASPFGQHRQRPRRELPAPHPPLTPKTAPYGQASEGGGGARGCAGRGDERPSDWEQGCLVTRSPHTLPLPRAPAGRSHTMASFAPNHSLSYPPHLLPPPSTQPETPAPPLSRAPPVFQHQHQHQGALVKTHKKGEAPHLPSHPYRPL